jgi:hypothetical protein
MKTFSDNTKKEKFRENIYLYQNDQNIKNLNKARIFKTKHAIALNQYVIFIFNSLKILKLFY